MIHNLEISLTTIGRPNFRDSAVKEMSFVQNLTL